MAPSYPVGTVVLFEPVSRVEAGFEYLLQMAGHDAPVFRRVLAGTGKKAIRLRARDPAVPEAVVSSADINQRARRAGVIAIEWPDEPTGQFIDKHDERFSGEPDELPQ